MCFTQRKLYALFDLTSLDATRNLPVKKPRYFAGWFFTEKVKDTKIPFFNTVSSYCLE